MLTQVLEDAADVRQGTGGNLERPPTSAAKAFGERSETGAFGQKFRQLLRRKKHARGPSLDTDVHADRLCVVEGPPGAGKTTILWETQRQLELANRRHQADGHCPTKAWLWVSPTRDLRAETEQKLSKAKVRHAHACTHESAVRSLAESPADCDWEAIVVDECFLVGMQYIWLYAHLAPHAAILMLGNRWQVQTIEPFTPWRPVDHPGSTDWCRGVDWYARINSLQLRDSYRLGGGIWQLARSILEKSGVTCCARVRAQGPTEGTCDYFADHSEGALLSRLWLDSRSGCLDLVSCVTNREMLTLLSCFENAVDPEGRDDLYVERLMPTPVDGKQTLGMPLGFKLWDGSRCVCRCTTAHRTIGMDTTRAAFVYLPAGADVMGRIAQDTGGHKVPAHLFTAVTRASNRMRLYLRTRDAGQLARYAPALYSLSPAPGSATLLAPPTASAAPAAEADPHDPVVTYRSAGALIFGKSGPDGEVTLLLLRTPPRRGGEPTAEAIAEGRRAGDASAPFTALRGIAEELLGMPEGTPPALHWTRRLLENVNRYGWRLRHLGSDPEDDHRSYIVPAEAAFAGGMDEAVQSFQPSKEATGVVLVRLGDLTGRETELVDRCGHRYRLRDGWHLGAGRINAIRALAAATATGAPAISAFGGADAVFRRAMDLVAAREPMMPDVRLGVWRVSQPQYETEGLALMLVAYEFLTNADISAGIPNYVEDISGGERVLSPLLRLYDAIRAEIVKRVARRANVRRHGVFALCPDREVNLEPGETKLITMALPQPMLCSMLILDAEGSNLRVRSKNDDPVVQVRDGEASPEHEPAQLPRQGLGSNVRTPNPELREVLDQPGGGVRTPPQF